MKPTRYITALLLTLSICAALYLSAGQSCLEKVSTLSAENNILKRQIGALSLQIDHNKNQIDNLTQQLNTLQDGQRTLRERTDFLDRGGERPIKRVMHVTAYWEGSCGKKPSDPLYGITASGEYVRDGMIAAYWPELPKGTRVYIPYFKKVFVVMDTGGAINEGDLDIYMRDAKSCFNFGVKDLLVYVLEDEEYARNAQ